MARPFENQIPRETLTQRQPRVGDDEAGHLIALACELPRRRDAIRKPESPIQRGSRLGDASGELPCNERGRDASGGDADHQ